LESIINTGAIDIKDLTDIDADYAAMIRKMTAPEHLRPDICTLI
jgi:hypothetical protein